MCFEYEIIDRSRFYFEEGFHPKDSVLVVIDGSFHCEIGGRAYQAGKYDVFVFGRQEPFRRRVLTPLRCVYVQFDRFPFPVSSGLLKTADSLRSQSSVDLLVKAAKEENRPLIGHFLNDLFILHGLSADEPQDQTVADCVRYLEENYCRPISLDLLAGRYSVSKQTLIARFNRCLHRSPIHLLNEIRIRQAKRLLTDSDDTVQQIALKCGFDNQYYFSGKFKQQTGLSPTAYRKKFVI